MKLSVWVILTATFYLSHVNASDGDRSPFYHKCFRNCMNKNCTLDYAFNENALNKQDIWCWLLGWSCKDDCRYLCMWKTVQIFRERGYLIPKFHGKWPFVRLCGVQEPASAFSSLLNLLVHVYKYLQLRKQFSVALAPLVLFWHIFAIVCVNAWFWSTIFHTRDTVFTEFMDYAGALSMVMALFIAAIVRIFHYKRKLTVIISTFSLLFYIMHVHYLYVGSIDYDYNMIVNISFGVAGSLLWLTWSVVQYVAGRRYVRNMVAFTVLSGVALLLELFDFPPKYNAWDAHALWHLSTAPLGILFYRFVFDDLHYIQSGDVKIYKSTLKIT